MIHCPVKAEAAGRRITRHARPGPTGDFGRETGGAAISLPQSLRTVNAGESGNHAGPMSCCRGQLVACLAVERCASIAAVQLLRMLWAACSAGARVLALVEPGDVTP